MEPIYESLSKERKEELKSQGVKEYMYPIGPPISDPDHPQCKKKLFLL